jgi:hypothetical protein
MGPPIDLHAFERLLAQTIAWCSRPGAPSQPSEALRTPALRPADYSDSGTPVPSEESLRALAAARAGLLRKEGIAVAAPSGGRLLVVDHDEVIGCFSAASATNHFFDGADLPGWDSWLCRLPDSRPRLLCWVPTAFVELAKDGMSASPTESIQWAADLKSEFVERLRTAGLLG